jgi:hypothetical protein
MSFFIFTIPAAVYTPILWVWYEWFEEKYKNMKIKPHLVYLLFMVPVVIYNIGFMMRGHIVQIINFISDNWIFIAGVMTLIFGILRYLASESSRAKDAEFFGIEKRMIEFKLGDTLLDSLVFLAIIFFTIFFPLIFIIQFASLYLTPGAPLYQNTALAYFVSYILSLPLVFLGCFLTFDNLRKRDTIGSSKKTRPLILLLISVIASTSYIMVFIPISDTIQIISALTAVLLLLSFVALSIAVFVKIIAGGYFANRNRKDFTIAICNINGKFYMVGNRHIGGNWILLSCALNKMKKQISVIKGKFIISSLDGFEIEHLNGFRLSNTNIRQEQRFLPLA